MKSKEHLDCIREAIRRNETDSPLGQAVARLKLSFVIGDSKNWHYEGFIGLFAAVRQCLAAIDNSISPDLPPFLLDPATIAGLFRIPVEDFNCHKDSDDQSERLARIEAKLERQQSVAAEAEFVSIKQCATITQLSDSHIRRAIWSRQLPAANAGTPLHPIWRIARKDLADWLKAKMGGSNVPPKSELGGLVNRYFPDA